MGKITLSSDWLDVCSGCHMSILDIDERIVELIKHVEFSAMPITDFKHPPEEGVDVGILTGAVSNTHQVEAAKLMRERCKILISLGDCAVFGGICTMRNFFDKEEVLEYGYVKTMSTDANGAVPRSPELGKLLEGPVIFPVSAQRALRGERADSGMDELVSHLTAFLAEERGRIVLDNALGEGLEAARCLFHGIDARRRAAKMSNDEIVRRIGRIEVDLQGQESSVEERRGAIREDVAAIRAWVRRDLDRFVDDVIRQLPELIEHAEVDDLRQHLASFLEVTFVSWAEAETGEVARALEELAEKTVALMRDSAHEAAERLSDGAQSDVEAPDIRVDTFGYDLGVAALFSVGMGMVFSNALLGMLMAGAAPVLAYYLKGRVEVETRDKARDQAAIALREAAAKVAPKIDEMITDFQKRLDTWVVEAGKEVHRELLDVLQSANKERAETEPNAERTAKECDELTTALDEIKGRLEGLRSSLWDPTPSAES